MPKKIALERDEKFHCVGARKLSESSIRKHLSALDMFELLNAWSPQTSLQLLTDSLNL